MQGIRFLISVVLGIGLSDPLWSEPRTISGTNDEAYVKAISDWLQGADLVALQSLSSLAQDGNTDAQILLASIASRGHMHVHVTGEMPRNHRIALLRMPGGLSGKSLLTAAEETEPLAAALLQIARVREKWPAIKALFEYGEGMEAEIAMRGLQRTPEDYVIALEKLVAELPNSAELSLVEILLLLEAKGITEIVTDDGIFFPLFPSEATELEDLEFSGLSPADV
ncbi:MAG: hypothetical protein AAFX00_06320, partial [Pseudomonadota bacterium]